MSLPALSQLVALGLDDLKTQHAPHLTPVHYQALHALQHCRSGHYGSAVMHCEDCGQHQHRLRSCGHRSCPQCQHHLAQQWLARQQARLLPLTYFLVTFTLPKGLRKLIYRHQQTAYDCLFLAAAETLKSFGLNHRQLNSRLGFCAVLHTHSRRLDYHPHLHVIVPGGGIDTARRQWRKLQGQYLFNGRQLATVFRAKMLHALNQAELRLPPGLPDAWVVQCQKVGTGLGALQYLSRYLYRGVIREQDIIGFDPEHKRVTFRYRDSKTKIAATRTLPLVQFLWQLMIHVLPKGFRRVRDYGFLSASARRLLKQLQLLLYVRLPTPLPRKIAAFCCTRCGQRMTLIASLPGWRPD